MEAESGVRRKAAKERERQAANFVLLLKIHLGRQSAHWTRLIEDFRGFDSGPSEPDRPLTPAARYPPSPPETAGFLFPLLCSSSLAGLLPLGHQSARRWKSWLMFLALTGW